MENFTTVNDNAINSEQLFFRINNKQVVFNTDKRTKEKLDNEDVLMNYVKAIINSKMLAMNGQNLINYPVNITRIKYIEMSIPFIELEVTTIVQDDGVEELHCAILNDGTSNNIGSSVEMKSIVGNQSVAEISSWNELNDTCISDSNVPALKWSTEMTSLMIALRGSYNEEFNSSKYKFKLWEIIARKLSNSIPSVKVSAKDCDDKWRNIAATYRKNIERIKYMGNFSVRWEHFAAMDEILKGTDDILKSDIEVDSMSGTTNDTSRTNKVNEKKDDYIMINNGDNLRDNLDYYFFTTTTTNANNEVRLWTQEMILLLFSLRRSMADHFDRATKETDKDVLWYELVTKMNKSLGGTNTDIESCEVESLWNQYVGLYEENLEKLKAEGPLSVKWPYFAIMDQMLGGTIEIPNISYPRPGEYLVPAFMQGLWKQSDVRQILNNCKADSNVIIEDDSDTSDDSVDETKAGVKWHPGLIRKLINLRSEAENEVKKWVRKPSSIWPVVLKKFRRIGMILLTEQDLENKWNSLVRAYNRRVSGISKRTKSQWPYFYGIQSVMNTIRDESPHSETSVCATSKSDQPPEWFLNYMQKKEAADAYRHEQMRNMLIDLKHSQIENRRLILSIFKKL